MRKGFTLVELLVVVAITSILAAMLLPALSRAIASAKQSACANNLKQQSFAHAGYQNDNRGFLVHNCGITYWANMVAPYLGYSTSDPLKAYEWSAKPNQSGQRGNVFTCAEQPEGNFFGHYPSFHPNDYMDDGLRPYRLVRFAQPSGKLYLGDAMNNSMFRVQDFFPVETGGRVHMRHPGDRANMLFLDGHCRAYGAPPIPPVQNLPAGRKWLKHDHPAPDGL